MYKNTRILESLRVYVELINIRRAIQTKVNLLHNMYDVLKVNINFELLISNGLF